MQHISPKLILHPNLMKPYFVSIWFLDCQIVLKFCSKHDSIAALLSAKFQNDLTIPVEVLDRYFARLEVNLRKEFWRSILYAYVIIVRCWCVILGSTPWWVLGGILLLVWLSRGVGVYIKIKLRDEYWRGILYVYVTVVRCRCVISTLTSHFTFSDAGD